MFTKPDKQGGMKHTMASGIDQRILDTLRIIGEADIYALGDKLGIPARRVEEVCDSLVEEGYLEQTDRSEYRLAKSERKKRKGPHFIVRF